MGGEDGKFFSDLSEKMEGFYPDLPKRIDELSHAEYGRAVVIGLDANQKVIGYILPLTEQQTRHLIIFKTGTNIVTEPTSSTPEAIREYSENFSPNSEGYFLSGNMNSTINTIKDGYTGET